MTEIGDKLEMIKVFKSICKTVIKADQKQLILPCSF